MTNSHSYTDHLIAALRCLDNDQLSKLANEITRRLVSRETTFEDWYHGKIGIHLPEAKRRGVTDLALLEEAWKYRHADHP